MLGRDKLIGLSIHGVTEAEALDPATVDYAIAGPVYETASKPGYGPEIGKIGLAEIARASRVPVLAIGGINPGRVAELLAMGIAGVAVMGGVMRAAAPGARGGVAAHHACGTALTAPAIGRDPLVRHPDISRQLAGLPEHVDWDTATRIPVTADAQPLGTQQRDQGLADGDRAILVE